MKKIILFLSMILLLTGCSYKEGTTLTDDSLNFNLDISKLNIEETKTLIQNEFDNLSINLYQNNKIVDTIYYKDLNIDLNLDNINFDEIDKGINNLDINYTINKDDIKNLLPKLNCIKNGTTSKDAYIENWKIVEEVYGTKLNEDKLVEFLYTELSNKNREIFLDDTLLESIPTITKEDVSLNERINIYNSYVNNSITYILGEEKINLDLSKWIDLSDTNEVILKEDLILDYVNDLANNYNTFQESMLFTTSKDITVEVPGGNYGWEIDVEKEFEELKLNILNKETIIREPIWSHKGYKDYINGLPGDYIEISITDQKLWLYIDYDLILETNIVSGNESKNWGTPSGIFGLTYKTRNAVLRGADYETPVKYWMPFNGNIGMHDASWRGSFGNSIYLKNGSHGCINLVPNIAKDIYSYVDTNFPIIVYDYNEDNYE